MAKHKNGNITFARDSDDGAVYIARNDAHVNHAITVDMDQNKSNVNVNDITDTIKVVRLNGNDATFTVQ